MEKRIVRGDTLIRCDSWLSWPKGDVIPYGVEVIEEAGLLVYQNF